MWQTKLVWKFLYHGFIVVILCCQACKTEKRRYVVEDFCDRYSLDALFYEKYKPITNNIFADTKEFVSRVIELIADSLTTVMAELPDRDASDDQERKIHEQFKIVKSTFSSKTKKMQRNITSAWEDLVTSHFDLMIDNGKASLVDYENKTVRMTDSYSSACQLLDTILSNFVTFVKQTLRDGLSGIEAAAEIAVKKDEEEKKKNKTEDPDEFFASVNKDDILEEKKIEISKMVVPGFLGKVTIEVIKKKINLKKELTTKSEERDNPLDDIEFDMIMIKNRIRAIVQLDVPKDKGAVDLARRSIYIYWADLAEEMYKEKKESAKNTTQNNSQLTGRLFYRDLWKDEEKIMETLLDLMEVYS